MVKIRRPDGTPRPEPTEEGAATSRRRPALVLDEQELARGYAAGKSIRTLATESGVAYGTMHSRLSAAGVEFRGRGDWRALRAKESQAASTER